MCRNGVFDEGEGPEGFFGAVMVSPLSDKDDEFLVRVLDEAREEGCDDCREGGPLS